MSSSTRPPARRALPTLCFTLLASSLAMQACSDMMLYRAGHDYFPLAAASRWTYESGSYTAIDSVGADSTVGGRRAITIYRNFAPEFWLKSPTEIRRWTLRTAIRNGTEYVLEAQYGLIYRLPFVEGASWTETFRDTVVLLGTDTIVVLDSVQARVSAIEELSTEAGTFQQCYRVDYSRVVHADTSLTEQYSEWLAPGVGLVQRVAGSETQVLVNYHIGPLPGD